MPYTTSPVTVTSAPFTITNPSTSGINSTPAVAVQIRNASPWLVQAVLSGSLKTIDAFQAITYTVTGDENLLINPQQQVFLNYPPGYLYTEWLAPGDSSSLPDGNINSQLSVAVAGSRLQGPFTLTGTTPQIAALPLLPTDRSIVCIFQAPTGSIPNTDLVPIQVTGNQSGFVYSETTHSSLQQTKFSAPVDNIICEFPVWGVLDSTLNIRPDWLTASGPSTMWVICQSDGSVMGMGTEPLAVRMMPSPLQSNGVPWLLPQVVLGDKVTTAYTISKVNATTGGTTPLLAAPSAGNYWEIVQLGIWQVTSGTVARELSINGHTTGFEYLELFMAATAPGNNGQIFSGFKATINEGLDLVNVGTGVTASGSVVYRSVPNTYDPI